jgi:hypothetical protein
MLICLEEFNTMIDIDELLFVALKEGSNGIYVELIFKNAVTHEFYCSDSSGSTDFFNKIKSRLPSRTYRTEDKIEDKMKDLLRYGDRLVETAKLTSLDLNYNNLTDNENTTKENKNV